GLPRGIMGKIRLAVSPASSNRVYAVVEAEDGGMYRSDDAGATWRRTSASRSIATRPWYYSGVTADPKTPDVVYVMGSVIIKSTAGGVTYHEVQTPHSDQHTLWINPSNADNMVETNDGGTVITLDGGATWSPTDNQPTGQFYAVQFDDLFPY